MATQRGLGKGLDALLKGLQESRDDFDVRLIPIDSIRANPDQPRKEFAPEALAELTESIRSQGVLQPILLRLLSGQEADYEIVAGERRWRAARAAGLKVVPALLRELSDEESLAIALIENLQREDLNPMEEARGYRQLQDSYGLSQEDLARKVGKSRSAVANTMRLLQLPEPFQEDLGNGALTAGHARALLAVADADVQAELRGRIVEGGLSVREAESQATFWKDNGALPQTLGSSPARRGPRRSQGEGLDVFCQSVAQGLSQALNTKVKVNGHADKGNLVISFGSQDELTRLAQALGYQPVVDQDDRHGPDADDG